MVQNEHGDGTKMAGTESVVERAHDGPSVAHIDSVAEVPLGDGSCVADIDSVVESGALLADATLQLVAVPT